MKGKITTFFAIAIAIIASTMMLKAQPQEPYYLFFDNFDTDYPPIETGNGTRSLFELLYYDYPNSFPAYNKYMRRTAFGPSAFSQKPIKDYDFAVFALGANLGMQHSVGGVSVISKIKELLDNGKGAIVMGSQLLSLGQQNGEVRSFIENELGIRRWGILPVMQGQTPTPYARMGIETDPVGSSVISWCNYIYSENNSEEAEPWRWYNAIELIEEFSVGTDSVEKLNYLGFREDPIYTEKPYYTAFKKEFENGGKIVVFIGPWDNVTKIHNTRTNQLLINSINWVIKDMPHPEQYLDFELTLLSFDAADPGQETFADARFRNRGRKDLVIEGFEMENIFADPGIFTVDNIEQYDFPITLGPGQSMSVKLKFAPDKEIKFEDSFTVISNAVNGDRLSVDLEGRGTFDTPDGPVIETVEGIVDMGYYFYGDLDEVEIPIYNTGDAGLTLSNIVLEEGSDPAFKKISPLTNPNVVTSGGTLRVTIRFFPVDPVEEATEFNASLLIASNARNIDTIRIPIKATLVPDDDGPEALVEIDAIDMGDVIDGVADTTFTIKNTGMIDLFVSSVAIDGSPEIINNEIFKIATESGFTIEPGEEAEVKVDFKTTESKTYNAEIVITSNAMVNGSIRIPITANSWVSVRDGIGGVPNLFEFSVSPNPVTNESTVEFNLNSQLSKYVRLSLIDITGRSIEILHDGVINPGAKIFKLSTSNITSGTYYLVGEVDGKISKLPVAIVK